MSNYHDPVKTKSSGTGAKRRKIRDKKLYHVGKSPTNTKVGKEDAKKQDRGRGGMLKTRLKTAKTINLTTKEGVKKADIERVLETPDNRHHARQNILTLGAIVQTSMGKAKITNRVGQDGIVNGRLI